MRQMCLTDITSTGQGRKAQALAPGPLDQDKAGRCVIAVLCIFMPQQHFDRARTELTCRWMFAKFVWTIMTAVRAQNKPMTIVRAEYHLWCWTNAATNSAAAWNQIIHHESCKQTFYVRQVVSEDPGQLPDLSVLLNRLIADEIWNYELSA